MKTQDEVTLNILWRTLQLRDFVTDRHTPTPWGRALAAALGALRPEDKLEEAAIIGMELLRLKVLKGENFVYNLPGAPQRGSGTS